MVFKLSLKQIELATVPDIFSIKLKFINPDVDGEMLRQNHDCNKSQRKSIPLDVVFEISFEVLL
jgi:hypothetical protein